MATKRALLRCANIIKKINSTTLFLYVKKVRGIKAVQIWQSCNLVRI